MINREAESCMQLQELEIRNACFEEQGNGGGKGRGRPPLKSLGGVKNGCTSR